MLHSNRRLEERVEPATSHLHVDNSKHVAYVVVFLVFLCLAIITVILRVWGRRIQKQTLALNDYLIVIGLVSSRTGLFGNPSPIDPGRFLRWRRLASTFIVSTILKVCPKLDGFV